MSNRIINWYLRVSRMNLSLFNWKKCCQCSDKKAVLTRLHLTVQLHVQFSSLDLKLVSCPDLKSLMTVNKGWLLCFLLWENFSYQIFLFNNHIKKANMTTLTHSNKGLKVRDLDSSFKVFTFILTEQFWTIDTYPFIYVHDSIIECSGLFLLS